jgi:hypothetical protein
MLTDTNQGRLLLNEVAYAIVYQEAPEELPMYVHLRDHYLADPEGFLYSESRDEALGFGVVVELQTLTEALFPILAPVLLHIVTQAALALQDEGGERAADWVRGWFRASNDATGLEAAPEPLFSQAQLDKINTEIAQIAEREGGRLGIGRQRIARVQEALIARLALATA